MTNAKRAQFDRLWNTDNVAKQKQFRNLMRAKLDQIKVPFTEVNARGFYMGEVKAPPPKEEYQPQFEERRPPPRRGRPGARGRGPSRRR